MTPTSTFNGTLLDGLQAKHGLTDAGLGALIGVAGQSVWFWRQGKRPSRVNLKRLADHFDMEPQDFLTVSEPISSADA